MQQSCKFKKSPLQILRINPAYALQAGSGAYGLNMESALQFFSSMGNPHFFALFLSNLPFLMIAAGLFLLGVLIGKLVRRHVKNLRSPTLKIAFVQFAIPLIPPAITTGIVGAGFLVARLSGFESIHILFFVKISIAWLAIRLVMRMTSRKTAGWFIVMVIIPITLLHLFGLWDDTNAILTSATFKVSTFKLNAYTVLKSCLALIVLFWIAGQILAFIQQRVARMSYMHVSHRTLLVKVFQFILYFFVFVVALQILGIDLTALSVFGGALGVGLGFGLQKIASNFISGVILLLEKSVQIGDMVELQDGTAGNIRKTGARYTLMETLDGREILIPNEDLITQRVTSWTHSNPHARVEIVLGVAYDADIDAARDIMLNVATAHPKCLSEPKPLCVFTAFGDYAITLTLYFWIADINDGRLEPRSDVIRKIFHEFKQHNIEIPYPQRVVHMKATP